VNYGVAVAGQSGNHLPVNSAGCRNFAPGSFAEKRAFDGLFRNRFGNAALNRDAIHAK